MIHNDFRNILPLFAVFLLAIPLSAQQRTTNCDNPTAQADLNVNGVHARITNGGDLWWDGQDGRYEVTADENSPGMSPATAIFAGGLWIGGVDSGGGLKIAAQQYGRNAGEFDYYPGPLTNEGTTEDVVCSNWDRLFPIYQEEVRAFLASYDPQNPPAADQVAANISGWPATGNPLFEGVHGFTLPNSFNGYAPFNDTDLDGIYNPLNGDYPLFCGDQAIWCIFNDAGSNHEDSATPVSVQAEIHLLAYAFASGDSILHRTTFYEYKIINRAQEIVSDFYAGHWIDSDLGCFENDLNNSSPENNLFYVYNASGLDPEDCTVGLASYGSTSPVNIFQLVQAAPRSASQEPDAPLMHSFNSSSGNPVIGATITPSNAIEYYNLLTGKWGDGTPLTRGGTGYLTEGDTTRFAYDGGEVNGASWLHCYNSPEGADTRQIYSTGPYVLAPGTSFNFTLAVTTIFGVDYPTDLCPNEDQVLSAAGFIKNFYDDNCSPSVLTSTETPRSPASIGLEVFPNPTAGQLTFRVPAAVQIDRLEVMDLTGRQLASVRSGTSEAGIDLKAAGFSAGVYVYRLRTATGAVVAGRVVLVE